MYSWIELDQQALLNNYQIFSDKVGGRFAPVIKSNAYGHGLAPVLEILHEFRPQTICVNYISEARQVREAGYSGDLLIVGPTPPELLKSAKDLKAAVFISSLLQIQTWSSLADKPKAHIKVDTGMTRQGFLEEDISGIISILKQNQKDIAAVCSHFANVEDVTNHEFAKAQIASLKAYQGIMKDSGIELPMHIASSASTLLLQESWFDLCRVGIALYGYWPSQLTKVSYLQQNQKLVDLKPVVSWYCRVSQVKSVRAGRYIGYGCTFKASTNMKIAVIPIGYAEGFKRIGGEHGAWVVINDTRCPVVGRVCMNMSMINVSHLPGIKAGDLVHVISSKGEEVISANDVAEWNQTINYEVLTNIHQDIPRTII